VGVGVGGPVVVAVARRSRAQAQPAITATRVAVDGADTVVAPATPGDIEVAAGPAVTDDIAPAARAMPAATGAIAATRATGVVVPLRRRDRNPRHR